MWVKRKPEKRFEVHAEGSDTVEALKQKIAEQKNIPVERQQLFFGKKELTDANTSLESYDIKTGSQIVLHTPKFTNRNVVLRLMFKSLHKTWKILIT